MSEENTIADWKYWRGWYKSQDCDFLFHIPDQFDRSIVKRFFSDYDAILVYCPRCEKDHMFWKEESYKTDLIEWKGEPNQKDIPDDLKYGNITRFDPIEALRITIEVLDGTLIDLSTSGIGPRYFRLRGRLADARNYILNREERSAT